MLRTRNLGWAFIRRSTAKTTAPLLALALALGPVWLSAASPVAAGGTCVGSRSNYFDGRFNLETQVTYGSKAEILTKKPTVCSGVSSFSGAWTMLDDTASGGYAQSGFVYDTGVTPLALYVFIQARQDGSHTPTTFYYTAPPLNSMHSYQSNVNSSGYIDMYIDSTLLATTGFKPASAWTPQPWGNQYSDETGHCQSDVAGTASAKEHYTNVLQERTLLGSFLSPLGLVSSHNCGSQYNVSTLSATSFDTWTTTP